MFITCRACGVTDVLESFVKDKRTANGRGARCKACERKRLKKFQEENREKVNDANRESYYKHRSERLSSQKQYASENKEKISDNARTRYARNRDAILASCAEYRRNNPDVLRAGWLRRRAREKSLDAGLTTSDLIGLIKRFDNRCVITGQPAEHLDHFIPMSTGHGGTIYENLVPLTATLNLSKNNRNPFVWEKTLTPEQRTNFEKVVEYLAELNGLTIEEYRMFVFWCFENKREPSEITGDNRDSLAQWVKVKC